MKRRKALEEEDIVESNSDDSTQKKTRSSRATSSPSVEDESSGSGKKPVRRRARRKDATEDEGASISAPSPVESTDGEVEAGEESEETTAEDGEAEDTVVTTPVKSSRQEAQTKPNGGLLNVNTPTKGLLNKKLFSTPSKTNRDNDAMDTPKIQRNANRSARKKSTRKLIENTILGQTSDIDDDEEDIAEQIYNSDNEDEDENGQETGEAVDTTTSAPVTPRKRGRPKGSKNRVRSPTPQLDLSAHEKYFYQNRGGKTQTSSNTLASLQLLDHEEYFSRSRKLKDHHEKALQNLEDIHSDHFNQWQFELSQDFNLCLYGFGSKRSLLLKFADHVYKSQDDHTKAKIVIVNGYVSTLTVRDVLKTVASAVSDSIVKSVAPADMLESVFALLEEASQHITLLIHSIDALPLRRPATQTILSRLCSHPQVNLVASADHPNFPLLWDSSLRSAFNFCFHDCTTFQPYSTEYNVVDEVNELFGRSGRRVGGKEGVSFVLKSLPENAKNLFRVLIGEQLASMDEYVGEEDDDDDDENEQRFGAPKKSEPGVEYRVLYQKAVEEFICSNEMNFRTLLKEFHDHQMIQSRKDALGTEMLSVPFRKEELETILEDIMS